MKQNGAEARFLLLEALLQGNNANSAIVLASCKSQGGLAALAIPDKNIVPIALNTLKAAANACPEKGGWEGLDGLRRKVLKKKVESSKRRGKGVTKDGSHSQSIVSDEKLAGEAVRVRLRLERAYLELLQIANAAASRDEHLRNQILRHISIWGKEFGLGLAKSAET